MQNKWRTTTRDFLHFKKQVLYWLAKFGLNHYRVVLFHQDWDQCDKAYGWFKSAENVANLGLSVVWDRPVTKRHLDQTALHEVLHVLLDNITGAANERFLVAGFIECEEEALIARLEKVLLRGMEIC